MFYLHVEILHSGYLVLTTALCKHLHYRFTNIPLPDPSPDHCAIIKLSAITIVNHIPTDRLISCNVIFQMISCLMIVRWSHDGQAKVCWWIYDVNVCKEQWHSCTRTGFVGWYYLLVVIDNIRSKHDTFDWLMAK